MKFAYTIAPGRGETRPDGAPCDMDVRVLPDGPTIRISQFRGAGARGCRLDPDALEQAVALTEKALAQGGVDLVLVNKFGKHEADGHGFRDAIAMALEADIPVLVGVNKLNQDAFDAFSSGVAQELPARAEDILDWFAQEG
ncbi:MAG: 3-dehydroquinate dehydratase [Rhodobacterales bacterium]|nr:MAG: 3-dehydroquinate dehydratase [Rhodobacterales bacterium]